MLNIKKVYRKDYEGEEIVQSRTFSDGQWNTVTEYVENHVVNNQISNRAVVFGNGTGREGLNISNILTKKSGLLGSKTLQSYGCNAFYRDYTPNFLVVTSKEIAKEISESEYTKSNIVYSKVSLSLEFPKNFYIIPYDPYADAGTTAAYIACFDGHTRIYLSGFNGQEIPGKNDNMYAGTNGYAPVNGAFTHDNWVKNLHRLISVYDDVDFVRVTDTGTRSTPDLWKGLTNLRQISNRDFIMEADL